MLSELGSSPSPDGDNDLVQRILADMNTSESSSNPVQRPMTMPPPAGNGRMISSPNPNTTYPLAMDPATATAHMIGKDFPTNGDFAAMMGQGGQGAYASAGFDQQQGGQQYQQQGQQGQPILAQLQQGKGWFMNTLNQFRQPILVTIIFFIVSLPVINVMLGHYLPSLLKSNGDLTTIGLLAKSVLAGALYWIILNVIVPLVSS
jgi:hypothetical protein